MYREAAPSGAEVDAEGHRPASSGEAVLAPSAAAGRRWAAGDREQVAVVSFSHAIQHCYPAVLGIVYPFALADFHVSYAVLGVVLGVAGLAGNVLQGLAGVVKRFPAGTLLGAQNLGIAVASALGALSPGMLPFAAARVLGTLVSWPQHPVGSAHLTDRLPHRRGFVLAVHTAGGNLGTLVAPALASAIIAVSNWRWALGSVGALTVLGALLNWTRVRTAPAGPPDPTSRGRLQAGGAGAAASPPVRLRHALRRRTAIAVLVAGTISAAGRGLGVLTTYIPAYLRTALHEPALAVGVLTTIVSLGAIAGPVLGGHLSDRLGRRLVLCTLYGCGALALAGFVLVGPGVVALALVGLVVGVFTYSEQPLRQALFSDAMQGVPARAAFGVYFAISQSVGALWITVLGFVVTYSSFRTAFFAMAASFVAAGAVIAVFTRNRAPASSPRPA
ncbi:MAG TPA: MFS transporter [Candidatus Dormibacteraeota bacterium]|nr:MFS transporter [Candidatus Dormibacteraeota bacterium]